MELMRYDVKIGSGGIIYIPSFVKIVSAFRSSSGEFIYRHKDSKVISKA
jgi:hypothetical protein